MDDYNHLTAAHYAAYRPPLHAPILKQLLGARSFRGLGLDVGCGTGQSAVALAEYCRHVLALDPSAAMLARAPEHPSVDFRQLENGALANQLPGHRFEVIAFGGSLFYQDAAEISAGLTSMLEDKAALLVYDFEVDFSRVFSQLGFMPPAGEYDHRCGFDDYLGKRLKLDREWTGTLYFSATAEEIAHLICSVRAWREVLLKDRSFSDLAAMIAVNSPDGRTEMEAECFGRRYVWTALD